MVYTLFEQTHFTNISQITFEKSRRVAKINISSLFQLARG